MATLATGQVGMQLAITLIFIKGIELIDKNPPAFKDKRRKSA